MILEFTEMAQGEIKPCYILSTAIVAVLNFKDESAWARSIIVYIVGEQTMMSPVAETTEQVYQSWKGLESKSVAHPFGRVSPN